MVLETDKISCFLAINALLCGSKYTFYVHEIIELYITVKVSNFIIIRGETCVMYDFKYVKYSKVGELYILYVPFYLKFMAAMVVIDGIQSV